MELDGYISGPAFLGSSHLRLPRFGGQASGLHSCDCTGVDGLLLVIDRTEVANRWVMTLADVVTCTPESDPL